MQKTARQVLQELENSGSYVFHGSGRKIDVLEPRQAINSVEGKVVPDDRPGVHASGLIDIAIFMALVNEHTAPNRVRRSFGYYGKGKLIFEVSKATLEQLKCPRGYVHVFNRIDFNKRNEIEYISYSSIKPIRHVEVGIEDMPAGLKIIP